MRRILILLVAAGMGSASLADVAAAAPGARAETDSERGTLIPTAGTETFSSGSGGGARCIWTKLEGGVGADAGSNGSFAAPGTREGPNGTETLYLKTCPGFAQLVYVPPVDVASLRASARRSVERQLPLPALQISPDPAAGGIIRVQNWLAVAPVVDVSATASVGPVWVTMTGAQDSLSWDMGTGGEPVTCEGIGAPLPAGADMVADDVNGAAPCGYTYEHVSAPQFGANSNLAYENTATTNWAVSWVDYTGAVGTLPDIARSTPWEFQVRQIQTVRVNGDD